MKRNKITIILAALLTAASVCSCDKEPISADTSDKDQKRSRADSTNTPPRTVQPWVDAETYDLPF